MERRTSWIKIKRQFSTLVSSKSMKIREIYGEDCSTDVNQLSLDPYRSCLAILDQYYSISFQYSWFFSYSWVYTCSSLAHELKCQNKFCFYSFLLLSFFLLYFLCHISSRPNMAFILKSSHHSLLHLTLTISVLNISRYAQYIGF